MEWIFPKDTNHLFCGFQITVIDEKTKKKFQRKRLVNEKKKGMKIYWKRLHCRIEKGDHMQHTGTSTCICQIHVQL